MPAPIERSHARGPNLRAVAPAQRGVSFNRVTSARQDVVADSGAARIARPGGTSPGSRAASRLDSHRPFSAQASPFAGMSSSWSEPQRPAAEPAAVRTTRHNYYPGMRTEQHPNANTAKISRSQPHICLPSRGMFLGGMSAMARPAHR
jgi:hypothetical protein